MTTQPVPLGEDVYDSTTIAFHWITAVLVVLMFVDAIAGIAINWRFRRYRKWATAEVERANLFPRRRHERVNATGDCEGGKSC